MLTFTPAQRVKVQTKALPPVNEESVVTPQTNFFERLQGYSVDEDEREEVPSNFNQFTSTPQFPGNWAETTQNFEFESEPPSPVENLQTYTAPETPYFSPSRLHSHLRREGDLWKGPSESPLTPLPDSEDEVKREVEKERPISTSVSVRSATVEGARRTDSREPYRSNELDLELPVTTDREAAKQVIREWIERLLKSRERIAKQEPVSPGLSYTTGPSRGPSSEKGDLSEEEFEMVDVRQPQLKQMPSRQARDRPEFDESEPENIVRYFEDLEMYFEMAGIAGDAHESRKKWVGTYVKPKLESEWKTLDSFENGTYEEYKEEILRDYDAVAKLVRGSIQRLEQICKEHQRISPADIDDFLTLKRQFKYEASKLLRPPVLLANHTLVEKFMGCLTPGYRNQVYQRLDLIVRTDERIKVLTNPGAMRIGAQVTKKKERPED